jgi:hypothetical protein
MMGLALVVPVGQAADAAKEMAAKYILATAKAARTVYVKGVVADASKGGMKLSEDSRYQRGFVAYRPGI